MVAAAVALYVVGLNKQDPDAAIRGDGLLSPVANLPPVLLPQQPTPADVDRVRFSLGLRGYRMDQVDEVLDRLRDELAAKDRRIALLESAEPGRHAPGAVPAPEKPDMTEPAATLSKEAAPGGQ